MEWTKFKKKPVEIEAVQLTEALWKAMRATLGYTEVNGNRVIAEEGMIGPYFTVQTLEGNMTAHEGAWLIKGIKGEIYACEEEIFKETYEKTE